MLDDKLRAERDKFLDGFGRRGDARLQRIGFGDNPNQHGSIPRVDGEMQ